MANEQSNDEELLRKEINHITRIFRQLRTEGTKLDQTYVKEIAVMAKSVDQWGKALTLAKASVENEKSMAQRWSDRSGADMKALKLRKLMNNEAQTSRKLLQQQKSDDVERHIKMRNVMGKSSDAFNFFTKSLTKGLGFGEAIGMATEKLRSMSKVAMEQMKLEEMKKTYDEKAAQSVGYETGDEGKADAAAISKQEKDVTKIGGDSSGGKMGKMQKSMGKMGKFASKHAGGMLLGAGAGGLILGVIIKALSVAPMFQAMMKLFKFAVTMILMPIGTFFGAILRPIMIGLIKTIAPQFKGWMKTAMKLGDQVGKFIMDFFTDPAKYLIGAMGGIIPMLVGAFSFPDWSSWNPFDDGKSQEEKDKEHKEYWDGVNKNLEDAWLSIYTPLTEFGTLLWDFFSVTIPNTINTFADGIWQGFKKIGKILLTPFLMFIGTINTIFLWLLPDLFKGFWEWVETGFGDLQSALTDWLQPILDFFGFSDPSEDFKDADTSAGKVKSFAESIEDWWKDIFGHTEESEADSKDASNAMEGITKVFDSAATWINNALSEISTYRYIDDEGNPQPTDDAVTASGISPININARGRPSWISKTAANGFSGMVNSPTMFMAGEAGAEHVNISPHGNKSSGVPVVNINIARIDKNADFEQLKPAIQRWILEANSRRGMI